MELQKQQLPNYAIQSYDENKLKINQQDYYDSVLVSERQLISPWPPLKTATLTKQVFLDLDLSEIDLIIFADAKQYGGVDLAAKEYLAQQNIGLEIMNLGAGCRTFNVLLLEQRAVLGIFRLLAV